MALNPDHWAWNRRRLEHHSGVFQERRCKFLPTN